MEGSPWGGSEELWFEVAALAIAQGHDVAVCIKKWETNHKKVVDLTKRGATLILREQLKKTLPNKILKKLGLKKAVSYGDDIKAFNPQAILISQGATFDFFQDLYLYNLVQQLKAPFSLISQFNFETGNILAGHEIEKIKNTRPWADFYFVSMRNLAVAQRQSAVNLPNTKFIGNLTDFTDLTLTDWPDGHILKMACVARLDCSLKAQDILLQALSNPEFQSLNFELNFYGSGPHKDHIQRLIDLYNLNQKVFIRGHVGSKREIWANNHILILPSIGEGTPLSVQECMLMGRPAIASDVGGTAELVINGKTGFLFPPCNIGALTTALKQLFATPLPALKAMGVKAAEHANATIMFNSAEVILNDLKKALNHTTQIS